MGFEPGIWKTRSLAPQFNSLYKTDASNCTSFEGQKTHFTQVILRLHLLLFSAT